MNRLASFTARSPFSGSADNPGKTKNLPVLSVSGVPPDPPQGEPMDVTPPASASMGPPVHSSPEMDQGGSGNTNGAAENTPSNNAAPNPTIGAAAAAQQPKVVQTAFIHKLYNMLEDQSIQHLISWSNTNESFVMSPSSEFSKVLAQYFKHTNISSFVRQLNMYGFHKVSDVFHTGSPDSTLWEFKHGNNNFKRGDLVGLREIKRRASRHALIHRDSFSAHKPGPPPPGTPAEPVPDSSELRLMNIEHSLFDMHSRLSRSEESHALLSSRCQALSESLVRCYQWTNSISHYLLSIVPDPDNPVHRDIANMQKDVVRNLDSVRALENPQEVLLSGRQPYFANMSIDPGPPVSPRQMPQDDSRRPSVAENPRPSMVRPPVPQHLGASPRRYGSIGGNSSPNYNRPPVVPPQQPPAPHPLSAVSSPPGPNLARRHTSADIRQHGWPPNNLPPAAGHSPGPWGDSHRGPPPSASDQHVRDVLAQYEMGGPKRPQDLSRQATPPLTADVTSSTLNVDSGWTIGGARYARHHDSSLPPTRRSSMASNVHSLLNPAETAERANEDDPSVSDDRKRKRIQ